jgi:hypothetical protein
VRLNCQIHILEQVKFENKKPFVVFLFCAAQNLQIFVNSETMRENLVGN